MWNLPSGRIEGYGTEMTIRTLGRLTTPDEFNNMIVRESNGTVIRLRDVGTAEFSPRKMNGRFLRGNGDVPMVGDAHYAAARSKPDRHCR